MATQLQSGLATGSEGLVCFVCDVGVVGRYYTLATCRTQTTKVRLIEKLGQLVGEDYMVVISEDDVICRGCATMINSLDRLEKEVGSLRSIVLRYLEKKYDMDDGELVNARTNPPPSPATTQTKTTKGSDEEEPVYYSSDSNVFEMVISDNMGSPENLPPSSCIQVDMNEHSFVDSSSNRDNCMEHSLAIKQEGSFEISKVEPVEVDYELDEESALYVYQEECRMHISILSDMAHLIKEIKPLEDMAEDLQKCVEKHNVELEKDTGDSIEIKHSASWEFSKLPPSVVLISDVNRQ